MTFKDYKHFTPIQLRFSDVDRLNHVNNACYLTYFETARVHYFQKVFGGQVNWSENGFVIARTEVNYLKPVYLKDEIHCFTKLISIGNKSMTLRSSVIKKINGELTECAEGLIILVAMDYRTQCKIPVPELWRQLIIAFEGKGDSKL